MIQCRELGWLVKEKTPWKELEEDDETTYVVRAPINIPLHCTCIIVYTACLIAYTAYAVWSWVVAPPVEIYSSMEASQFGPVQISVEVECDDCRTNTEWEAKWRVVYFYDGFDCDGLGGATIKDASITSVMLCRTTDDIRDPGGVTVGLGNLSNAASRATVRVTGAGDLSVTTPLETWHEKTLLLGLAVRRESEDCEEASCALDRELFLTSMQYDGHVDWGDEQWSGAQLNLRMPRNAHVYTIIPEQTIFDVLAAVGGASGMLILGLGFAIQTVHIASRFRRMRGAQVSDASGDVRTLEEKSDQVEQEPTQSSDQVEPP
jgi:hypothetical protein